MLLETYLFKMDFYKVLILLLALLGGGLMRKVMLNLKVDTLEEISQAQQVHLVVQSPLQLEQ